MKRILLLLAAVSCLTANAQLSAGPEIGLNISNIGGAREDYTFRSGARLGFVTDFKIAENLYLQPGLLYSSKGGHTVTTSSQNLASFASLAGLEDLVNLFGGNNQFTTLTVTNNISYDLQYLQLPVLAVYKFSAGNSGRFFAGVGPYAAWLAGGHYQQSSVSSLAGISINTNEDRALTKGELSAFDFGLNANLGYQHHSGFFFRGFYEMGISDNSIGKNASFGISIGYLFSAEDAVN
jgi:hypothetical protein